MSRIYVLFITIGLIACSQQGKVDVQENAKKQILQTERDFNDMVATKGIAEAFAFYADENAAIQRRDTVIRGKEAIRKNYMNWRYTNVVLTWKPDFVEVSSCGDLGYTYGKYLFSAMDSTGQVIHDSGIFHTVWKRQGDGTWRYVWD